jgi:hypothetical protein
MAEPEVPSTLMNQQRSYLQLKAEADTIRGCWLAAGIAAKPTKITETVCEVPVEPHFSY